MTGSELLPLVRPCRGLSVVEVAAGTSDLGLGLAGGVPGMILSDLGATVTRIAADPVPIDRDVAWGQAWHADKHLVQGVAPEVTREWLERADVALVYGPEDLVEGCGLGWTDISGANPALVYARCRPSRTSEGRTADFSLLVEARAGFCTQLAGHRPGPIFPEVRASGSGAAFLLTASVLALLCRRAETGIGGWAETSLYDGLLATLGCMIGRSERAPRDIEAYWEQGSTFPNFLYRCGDGELLQVWFGGKGMYARLIEELGDVPSDQGYYTDQVSGALNERAVRWRSIFATKPRDRWIEQLREAGVACEPVLGPGEALADPHLADVGLAVTRLEDGHPCTRVATPIQVRSGVPLPEPGTGGAARTASPVPSGSRRLLEGLRVVDFSAFVAGPLAAQVLADLGADVVKVEPPAGETMRAAAYAVAACQRGKRSLALDIAAPEARPVTERLLRWADVVLHNFRVGVSERLGIDENSVARLNPGAVYCHATAFGATGRRAGLPGNDALMQAVTGFEQAVGGEGNEPTAATWIPIDMSSGWVTAIGILAGLFTRARTGAGCRVSTSLLGAGMLIQSGVHQRDGALVSLPRLDAQQTGYGPGYRLYRCGDDRWFALVVPDEAAWHRLGSLAGVGDLPVGYHPVRGGPQDTAARAAEVALEVAFGSGPAEHWIARLEDAGLLVEPVEVVDRAAFRSGVLDDPVNRQLGRVVTYATEDWGCFEQIGPLLRCGPGAGSGPKLQLPGVGEHSVEVLEELGVGAEGRDGLLAAKVVHQLDRPAPAP